MICYVNLTVKDNTSIRILHLLLNVKKLHLRHVSKSPEEGAQKCTRQHFIKKQSHPINLAEYDHIS